MNKPKKGTAVKWYIEWFDSPYYHLLYHNRDENEARCFIDELLLELNPKPGARILDLACGKGRYSRYLAEKGYAVTGIDLSANSIKFARQFETENLSFFIHDMRLPFRSNYFDFIFNFFTSFGYFDSEREELKTLQNVHRGLRPDGIFVLDFFNSQYVIDHLQESESKDIAGIGFDLQKSIEGRHVIKTINFTHNSKKYYFRERVRLFLLADFERLFATAGLKLIRTYGNYRLQEFDPQKSPRLILVAQKR